eukprot:TRINITY_DN1272_c0_g1_i1.p1 TRINITY_DN1272_c0_g1~~TRINITY_DN1272_c0_g1_i1.p1  ORF type:complete len:558 (-),score=139.52 TRINITY_DN1272_c0_g1_i1:130-1803(-)
MAKLIVKGLLAGAACCSHASGDYTQQILAEDSECAAEHCSFNALQKRAREMIGEEVPDAKSAQSAEPSPPAVEAVLLASARPDDLPKPKIFDSVNPIIARGNFLYDSVTGHRFFAKGVAYNPRNEKYDHSFGNAVKVKGWVDQCKAGDAKTLGYTQDTQVDSLEEFWDVDLEAIANMGANTVRLYNIDPAQSHAKFMKKAASLGLYVIVPLNGKDWGFLPAFPSPDCYTQNITGYGVTGVNALSFAKQVVKEFSQYDNTLLFTVANELPQNDKNGWAAFPCVKALTRDVHRYQQNCSSNMRKVPLIYSDVDMGGEARGEIAQYLTCALESEDDAVDAYGLNVYSWCDKAYPGDGKDDNFDYSPYKDIKKDFDAFPVPFLFTEFGCNLGDFKTKCPYKGGRQWPEVKHFLGPDMGQFMSGAIAFQWSMDKEEYGLTLSPGFLAGQEKLVLLDNYYALKKVYDKYNVSQKWDASPSKVDSCSFVPSDVAAMNHKHERPQCPGKAVWTKLQKQRGVDTISDWSIIPAPADAPLADAGNQSECPASTVPDAVQKMACFKEA